MNRLGMNRASSPVALLGLLSALSLAACSSAAGTGTPGSSASGQNGASNNGSSNGSGDDGTGDDGASDAGLTQPTGDDAGTSAPGAGSDGGTPSTSDGGEAAKGDAGTASTAPFDYAPYFPTWTWGSSGYAYTSLTDLQKKSGLNEVTIAFVLSNGGCNTTQDIEQNLSDVKAFVAAGGHVKASFGGADGNYLESTCTTAATLAKAYEAFVDATGITDLDFDVEQDPMETDAVNALRGQALKMAQDSKGIKVAFTLPANPSPNGGLTDEGKSVVSNALSAGVKISHVNFMTMDYGDSFAGKALAPVVEGSLTDGQKQIMSLVSGISSADAWAMVGVIPMIGKNDDSEVFSLADAKTLTTFATTNHVGLVSFWSIDRDQPGTDYNNASTVESTAFAFTDVFQAALK